MIPVVVGRRRKAGHRKAALTIAHCTGKRAPHGDHADTHRRKTTWSACRSVGVKPSESKSRSDATFSTRTRAMVVRPPRSRATSRKALSTAAEARPRRRAFGATNTLTVAASTALPVSLSSRTMPAGAPACSTIQIRQSGSFRRAVNHASCVARSIGSDPESAKPDPLSALVHAKRRPQSAAHAGRTARAALSRRAAVKSRSRTRQASRGGTAPDSPRCYRAQRASPRSGVSAGD